MQANTFKGDLTIVVNDKTFKGHITDDSNDSAALSLFYRPYYTDDQVPDDGVISETGFWGRNIVINNCIIDGTMHSEGLKISFGHNIVVKNSTIIGGYEDCIDIVRGANITFQNCKIISNNTRQHVTVKGGARNITFDQCEFINRFEKFYNGAIIDIGNWTNYDIVKRPKVRNLSIINCKLTNIKFKLLARVLYGLKPTVKSTNGFIFKIPSIITRLFFTLRKHKILGPIVDISENDSIVYNIEK